MWRGLNRRGGKHQDFLSCCLWAMSITGDEDFKIDRSRRRHKLKRQGDYSLCLCLCGIEGSRRDLAHVSRVLCCSTLSFTVWDLINHVVANVRCTNLFNYRPWQWSAVGGREVRGFKPPPRNSEGPPKACQTELDCENLKIAEFRTPTPQDVRKKAVKLYNYLVSQLFYIINDK